MTQKKGHWWLNSSVMTFVHEKDMSEDWIKVNQLPFFKVDEKKLHLKKKNTAPFKFRVRVRR